MKRSFKQFLLSHSLEHFPEAGYGTIDNGCMCTPK